MKKVVLTLNKPIYVGFTVLELSKVLMYDCHYNYFKKKFDCTLLFTDTDSLTYEIKSTEDIYEKIYEDKNLFDVSDYCRDYFLMMQIRKLPVKWKMKWLVELLLNL